MFITDLDCIFREIFGLRYSPSFTILIIASYNIYFKIYMNRQKVEKKYFKNNTNHGQAVDVTNEINNCVTERYIPNLPFTK